MNHLVSVRTNVIFSKDKDGNYPRFQEIIFLVDKPTYRFSNEGAVIRERSLEELRFTVSDEAYGQLIDLLTKLRTAEPGDLI